MHWTIFPKLIKCSFPWRAGGESIFSCRGLRRLYISGLRAVDLSEAGKLENLEELLLFPTALKNLNGISQLRSLRYLRLGAATKLTDIAEIRACRFLERAEFNQCRKVHDFSALSGANDIKRIELVDCGKIKDLKWISKLNCLEELFFSGDTYIEDGDLTSLLSVPTLKTVTFQARKHYSHRSGDFRHR